MEKAQPILSSQQHMLPRRISSADYGKRTIEEYQANKKVERHRKSRKLSYASLPSCPEFVSSTDDETRIWEANCADSTTDSANVVPDDPFRMYDKNETDFAISLLDFKNQSSGRKDTTGNNNSGNNDNSHDGRIADQVVSFNDDQEHKRMNEGSNCDVSFNSSSIAHLKPAEISALIPLLTEEVSRLLLWKRIDELEMELKMRMMYHPNTVPDLNMSSPEATCKSSPTIDTFPLAQTNSNLSNLKSISDKALISPLRCTSSASSLNQVVEQEHEHLSSGHEPIAVSDEERSCTPVSICDIGKGEDVKMSELLKPIPVWKGLVSCAYTPSTMIDVKSVDQGLKKTISLSKTKNVVPEKKSKNVRKKAPPEGWPKQPLSAYNLFFKDERARILRELNPDVKLDDIEVEQPENSGDVPTSKRKRGRPRGPNYRQRRPKHGQISFQNLAKTVGAKWKSLPAETLAIYNERAQLERAKYDKEVEAFHKIRRKNE